MKLSKFGPPDEGVVIARTLCVGSLILRSTLEWLIQSHSEPGEIDAYKGLTDRLNCWLNEQEFSRQFTRRELNDLSQAFGSWSPAQLDQQRYRGELLGMLYWALSIYREIPAYVQPFETPNLGILLGWPTGAATNPYDKGLEKFPRIETAWLKQVAHLRPTPVIWSHRKTAECYIWRLNATALQRDNVPLPPDQSYEMLIAIAAEEGFKATAVGRPIDDDFPMLGRPFRELNDSELGVVAMTTSARLLTLNWLCGYATEWDDKG